MDERTLVFDGALAEEQVLPPIWCGRRRHPQRFRKDDDPRPPPALQAHPLPAMSDRASGSRRGEQASLDPRQGVRGGPSVSHLGEAQRRRLR